jgi:hypothetical protein
MRYMHIFDGRRPGGPHPTPSGWPGRPACDYPDIPRHLWGDVGLPEGGAVPTRRRFLDRIRRR